MYERILVPLDGSNTAEIVIPYVEEIAAKLGAEIILVGVSESSATDTTRLYSYYLERITEQVKRQVKDYGAKEEVKIRSKVLLGNPAIEILRHTDEMNAGLIAMASRGSSGSGPWFLGNIAAKVLRAATKPVLLIRAAASSTALQQKSLVKRILMPLDGSKTGEAATQYTEMLARALGAKVMLLQVVEPVKFVVGFETVVPQAVPQSEESIKDAAIAYLDSLRKSLEEKGIRTSIVVLRGSAANQIIDYAVANTVDLIAMSTHGLSGIGRWVFGSVTGKVLHAGETPILVVRPSKSQ
jgi:nucleotide-binding universal stress UspA family protein